MQGMHQVAAIVVNKPLWRGMRLLHGEGIPGLENSLNEEHGIFEKRVISRVSKCVKAPNHLLRILDYVLNTRRKSHRVFVALEREHSGTLKG